MVGPIPNTLRELTRFGGAICVKCKRCGRIAHFNVSELANYFCTMRIRDDWRTIATKFKCQGFGDGCGSKNVEVTWAIEAPAPPQRPPKPIDVPPCPTGIDQAAWDKADEHGRKRLVRQLRS
jgi:hypothetical protein